VRSTHSHAIPVDDHVFRLGVCQLKAPRLAGRTFSLAMVMLLAACLNLGGQQSSVATQQEKTQSAKALTSSSAGGRTARNAAKPGAVSRTTAIPGAVAGGYLGNSGNFDDGGNTHGALRNSADLADNAASNQAKIAQNYGKIALSFEASQGQTDARVWVVRGAGHSLLQSVAFSTLKMHIRNYF